MCSSGSGGRENKEEESEVLEEKEKEGEVDSIWRELKLLGELPLSASGNFDPEG